MVRGRSTARIKQFVVCWSLVLHVHVVVLVTSPLFQTHGRCEGFRVQLHPSYRSKFLSQRTWGSVGLSESLQPFEEGRNNNQQEDVPTTTTNGDGSQYSSALNPSISAQTSASLADAAWLSRTETRNKKPSNQPPRNKMELMWCSRGGIADTCIDAIRERTVGEHNQILLNGPATGQVAYYWNKEPTPKLISPVNNQTTQSSSQLANQTRTPTALQCVLFLIKQGGSDNNQLLRIAAEAAHNLTSVHSNLHILLDPGTAARLKHYHGVDGPQIHLFEAVTTPGFGRNISPSDVARTESCDAVAFPVAKGPLVPDLICTLGGDGLLMHAGMLFQSSIPPILCVSGGSMGFLTPFQPNEMVEAIEISLGMAPGHIKRREEWQKPLEDIQVFPPNMPTYHYDQDDNDDCDIDSSLVSPSSKKFQFGADGHICMSIRMRLDCRIINREGAIKARYNVLNEVVIDRGSSPYLAALECFCDDVHLTTVQADGVIFATPTGSTAYSLAAGSSVVHPAVPVSESCYYMFFGSPAVTLCSCPKQSFTEFSNPHFSLFHQCVLLTPICPHVLSFRSMVFPDHVVLRCYVPDDARSDASVAFDGKHRQELRRGDSVQIQMSAYPVPTINRKNHSADWLDSLKRNFNFNARPRQKPL